MVLSFLLDINIQKFEPERLRWPCLSYFFFISQSFSCVSKQTYVKHAVAQSSLFCIAVHRSTALMFISLHSFKQASEYTRHASFVRPRSWNLSLIPGIKLYQNSTSKTETKEVEIQDNTPQRFANFLLIDRWSTKKNDACTIRQALLRKHDTLRICLKQRKREIFLLGMILKGLSGSISRAQQFTSLHHELVYSLVKLSISAQWWLWETSIKMSLS